MEVINKKYFESIFPLKVECKRVVDRYGFAYGKEKDFCGSELRIESEDIKKHKWFKYPDYEGVDYGVVCPVCGKFIVVEKNFIPNIVLANAEEIRLNT